MPIRLIAYDIPDDRVRTQLAQKLEAYGFERWQYSVFCGSHTPTQWQYCHNAIQKLLKQHGKGNEKIMILLVGAQELQKMISIGSPPNIADLLNPPPFIWIEEEKK